MIKTSTVTFDLTGEDIGNIIREKLQLPADTKIVFKLDSLPSDSRYPDYVFNGATASYVTATQYD